MWLRWLVPDQKLPLGMIEEIENAEEIAVSAISCWEVAYLVKKKRIELSRSIGEWMTAALTGSGISVVYVSDTVAVTSANLPDIHRDPADRIIIATAIIEDFHLASLDSRFKEYAALSGRLIAE